jgi:hypothetical protein
MKLLKIRVDCIHELSRSICLTKLVSQCYEDLRAGINGFESSLNLPCDIAG